VGGIDGESGLVNSFVCLMGGVRPFAEIVPAVFGHFDSVVFGRGFDIGERLFPFLVGDVLDLVETSDGITDMRCVAERFFAFVGESEHGGG